MGGAAIGVDKLVKGVLGDPKADQAKEDLLRKQLAEQEKLLEEKQLKEEELAKEKEAKDKLRAAKKIKRRDKSTGRRGTVLNKDSGFDEASTDAKTLLGS